MKQTNCCSLCTSNTTVHVRGMPDWTERVQCLNRSCNCHQTEPIPTFYNLGKENFPPPQTSGTETKWEERFRTLISKRFTPSEVISFIKAELTKAREDTLTSDRLSLVEVLEGMKKEARDFARPTLLEAVNLAMTYNSAIDNIISRLKSSIN